MYYYRDTCPRLVWVASIWLSSLRYYWNKLLNSIGLQIEPRGQRYQFSMEHCHQCTNFAISIIVNCSAHITCTLKPHEHMQRNENDNNTEKKSAIKLEWFHFIEIVCQGSVHTSSLQCSHHRNRVRENCLLFLMKRIFDWLWKWKMIHLNRTIPLWCGQIIRSFGCFGTDSIWLDCWFHGMH